MRQFCFLALVGLIPAYSPVRADQVDNYLKEEMDRHRIPGAALLVVQTNQIVKRTAYGVANLELKAPTTPETVFEIGSVTKQFTAACILFLQQDGKLSVEDKISTHLRHSPASWQDITVRHLLTHTSGIKSYTGLDGYELRKHLTQDEFIDAIGAYPLEFAPGNGWKYCNTGYNLLGFIVENVSGKSFWDFLSERVLTPLGMTSTTKRLPSLIVANRASGYEQTNHVWINRDYDLTDVFSAGALLSTIDDLAKWNDSLDTGRLLTAATRKQMWTPTTLQDGGVKPYGYGWRIDNVEGHSNVGHGGSTSGFSATIQKFPEDRLAVILLTNTDEQIATDLARKVAAFYFSARLPSK
jgi:CubicO group peptidase (beta-lactamase class C family)